MFSKIFTNIRKNHIAYLIIIFGLLGTMSAFYLLYDRIEIYKNTNYVPGCTVNLWLDCGRVMQSKWSNLFGFPNTFIGLMTYPMATLVGIFILGNKKNNRMIMLGCMIASGLGVIANLLLLYISAYLIQSLCPWCLLAGVCTTNIFYALFNYNVLENHLRFKPETQAKLTTMIKNGYSIVPLALFYTVVAGLVALGFYLPRLGIYIDFADPVFWLR